MVAEAEGYKLNLSSNNPTGYLGVKPNGSRYIAVYANNHIGSFDTAVEAAGLREAQRQTHRKTSKTMRCNSCTGCQRMDCGRCPNCRDKPKFGGAGVKKQSCIHRMCLTVQAKCPTLQAKSRTKEASMIDQEQAAAAMLSMVTAPAQPQLPMATATATTALAPAPIHTMVTEAEGFALHLSSVNASDSRRMQ